MSDPAKRSPIHARKWQFTKANFWLLPHPTESPEALTMEDYAESVPLCLVGVSLNMGVGQLPSMEIASRTNKAQMNV
jgi:hypothetical protein